MTMVVFLIPKVGEFEPREDMVNALLESIAYQRWFTGTDDYKVFSMSLNDISECSTRNIPLEQMCPFVPAGNAADFRIIPVGSLEFVSACLAVQSGGTMVPLNVPSELIPMAGRKVIDVPTDKLPEVVKQEFLHGAFIKSQTRIKAMENGIYMDSESLPEDVWQVSEILTDIAVEYRVIGYGDKILHIANTYENIDVPACSIPFIRECLRSWHEKPPAYTLDIAVSSKGECMVIEAHNFISCGLYGFDRPDKFIPMITRAYRWEQNDKTNLLKDKS